MKRLLFAIQIIFLTACAGTSPSLTPIPSSTPSPQPTTVPTATPFAETEIELINVGTGELTALTEQNIQAGMYDAQLEGLKILATQLRKAGEINRAKVPVVFLQDQNNDPKGVYAAIDINGTLIFPPLRLEKDKIPVPAYDATDDVNAPLKIKKQLSRQPWIDPVTGLETDDVQQLMNTGYTEVEANYLVDNAPTFAVRGRQFVRMDGKTVVSYIDSESGRWVKEETRFEMMPELSFDFLAGGGVPPKITQEDIDNKSWLHFVMRNCGSVAPDMSKIIWRPISGGPFLTYVDPMEEVTPIWLQYPETRMSRRVSWAATDSSYPESYKFPFDTVRVAVFYNPDGSQVWMQVVGNSNPGAHVNPEDLPRYDMDGSISGLTTPIEMKELYDEWINSGNQPSVPEGLDELTIYRLTK